MARRIQQAPRRTYVAGIWWPVGGDLDIHKKTVVACVLAAEGREVRTFGTVTRELLRLADWLGEERVTHVAWRARGCTGYNLLEDQGIELMVVNAQHIKTVPDLLRHGLLRASFIPIEASGSYESGFATGGH